MQFILAQEHTRESNKSEHVMAPCEPNVHRLAPTHAGEERVVNKSSCFRQEGWIPCRSNCADGLRIKTETSFYVTAFLY